MKTTKDEIVETALRLFAERGFDAVSTSMIAGELGITKGALYRHFESKQDIFESILQKMIELDAARAAEDHVPEKTFAEDAESYQDRNLMDFVEFVNHQFDFWTEDPFASSFRRMLTIEQFKGDAMREWYQNVLARGPVDYTADLFEEMLREGKLNDAAKEYGARNLAVEFYAPLQLLIQMADGGTPKEEVKRQLREITEAFERRWMRRME